MGLSHTKDGEAYAFTYIFMYICISLPLPFYFSLNNLISFAEVLLLLAKVGAWRLGKKKETL